MPCKNLENMYNFTFISVFAIKLEHCAKIDNPLNAIKKLQSEAKVLNEREFSLLKLLQPIVISNKPLIKALTISEVILKGYRKMQSI